MKTLRVFDLLHKRAVVTRESARVIGQALAGLITDDEDGVALDFQGVEAVAPSFVDETLAVVDEAFRRFGARPKRIVFLNPPMRLSSKFAAVGRARSLQINESEDGAWVITAGPAPRVA